MGNLVADSSATLLRRTSQPWPVQHNLDGNGVSDGILPRPPKSGSLGRQPSQPASTDSLPPTAKR